MRASPGRAAAAAHARRRRTRFPTGSGEQITRSIPSDSSASATPTTSPIASTAPTSWKCTCSGSIPWMRPSACASRSKAFWARVRGRSSSPAASIWSRIEDQCRCGCPGAPLTVTVFAVIPCRSAVPSSSSRPSTSSPERSTSRAGVEQRAQQHVPGHAGDAVDVEDPAHADCLAIRAAIVPGAEPVVDVHDRDPRRARRQHRQQRAHAAERRAVPGARRHRDHRRADQPADHRSERRIPAGDHDHAVRPPQILERRLEPVQPRHARVAMHDHGRSQQFRAHLRLGDDRPVRRAPGHDRHHALRLQARCASPTRAGRARPPRRPPRPRAVPPEPPRPLELRARSPRHRRAARGRSPRSPRASCPRPGSPRARPDAPRGPCRRGRTPDQRTAGPLRRRLSVRQFHEAAGAVDQRHRLELGQSASSSRGLWTSTARHWAREIATLRRWASNRKSRPRGTSSPDEQVIA